MTIIVFTDGSCVGNGTPTSTGGIGIYFPNKELNDISDPFFISPITNQRAELYAIYTALDKIYDVYGKNTCVHIYSDSLYAIKTLTEWRFKWIKNGKFKKNKVCNTDILIPLIDLLDDLKVEFTHVFSHTKKNDPESLGNEIADKLANKGRLKGEKIINNKTIVNVKIIKPKEIEKEPEKKLITVDTTGKNKLRLSDIIKF